MKTRDDKRTYLVLNL